MQLPKAFTTVTPFSKALALVLFVTLPVLMFIFGMSYQKAISEVSIPKASSSIVTPTQEPIACTEEVKICPDGSAVGRAGPNCEFTLCPSLAPKTNKNMFCGGIAGKPCPTGYDCKYDGTYPDAGGTCIKTATTSL